jgi:hypothetical protein
MHQCYHCGNSLAYLLDSGYRGALVPRNAECEKCKRDIRCCKNCTFYSPGSHWDCSETLEDPVYDKEKGNFCPYFTMKDTGSSPGKKSSSDAKNAFLNLFADSEPE